MALIETKKRKDLPVMWTDVNNYVLITALVQHSNGRYSNLANARGKWALVVSDFEKGTGWLAVQLQFLR
jgi:hypothetical protein